GPTGLSTHLTGGVQHLPQTLDDADAVFHGRRPVSDGQCPHGLGQSQGGAGFARGTRRRRQVFAQRFQHRGGRRLIRSVGRAAAGSERAFITDGSAMLTAVAASDRANGTSATASGAPVASYTLQVSAPSPSAT